MGFLSRKKGNGGEMAAPEPAQQASAIPDYGFNLPAAQAPRTISGGDIAKTTSYPVGYQAFARFTGKERTTSYVQPSTWSRRTYDTIN